jgi:hypothetical protein
MTSLRKEDMPIAVAELISPKLRKRLKPFDV